LKTRKLIYLAGPISQGSTIANVARADCAMLELIRAGFAVVNPRLTCWAGAAGVMDHPQRVAVAPLPAAHGGFREVTHADWIANCLPVVERADAVLRLPGASVGADLECAHAKEVGVPVLHSIAEVVAFRWLP
jgi:hypothetical protein